MRELISLVNVEHRLYDQRHTDYLSEALIADLMIRHWVRQSFSLDPWISPEQHAISIPFVVIRALRYIRDHWQTSLTLSCWLCLEFLIPAIFMPTSCFLG